MPDCRYRGRIQWRNIVRVVFTRAARLMARRVKPAFLISSLACLRLLQRACRIAGGSNRETQLRGFTNRGVSQ